MQKCSKCSKEYTRLEVFKALLLNSKIKCSKCNTYHAVSQSSSTQYKILCLIIPLIVGGAIKPYSILLAVVAAVITAILLVGVFTFFVKFKPVNKLNTK